VTLVFLDHSFHRKTRSTFFLQEAWANAGWTVVNLWDEAWQGGREVTAEEVAAHRPDVLLSFQVLKSAQFYRDTGCSKILLVPMYDSSRGMKPWDWWEYRHCSFLHFSSTLGSRTTRLGIPGRYLQFFPDPARSVCLPWAERTGNVFYWQRVENLPYTAVADYLRSVLGAGPHKFHWHHAVDPGEQPEPVDATGLELTETHWFADHCELQALLTHQKVYIAPRLAEGIGMSFLEAMAMGCAVVAQNDATMNEYIVHGQTGVLVDWSRPDAKASQGLDFQAIGERARRSIEVGYPRFQAELVSVVENWESLFCTPRRPTLAGWVAAVLYGLRHRVLRPLKHWAKRTT